MALSNKQTIFVESYLATWNAAEAARQAGYSHARSQGHRLLTNVDISKEIKCRIDEKTLTADEVLVRLAEHARGDIGDFYDIPDTGEPSLNLAGQRAKGKTRLIKKLKTKSKTYLEGKGDDQHLVTEVDVEFELYDAQSALEKIGRHHKLFTDVTELTGKDGQELIPLALVKPGYMASLK